MKIIKTASGRSLKMSKKEWNEMGKNAGWLKHSDEEEITQDIPTAPEPQTQPQPRPQPMGWDPAGVKEEAKGLFEDQTEDSESDLWADVTVSFTSKETKYGVLTFITLIGAPKALTPILQASGWGGKRGKPFLNRMTGEWEWSKIVNERGSVDADPAMVAEVKLELDAHNVDTSPLTSVPIAGGTSSDTREVAEDTGFNEEDVPDEIIRWHNEMQAASKLSLNDRKQKYSDIIFGALSEVGDQAESDASSEKSQEIIKALLSASSKFHNYSFWNSMMIALYKPGAEYVASKSNWQIMGRVPKKGATKIPIMFKRDGRKLDDDEKTGLTDQEIRWKEKGSYGLGSALAYEDTQPISADWISKKGRFKGKSPFEPPVWQIDSQEATPWLNQLYAATYKWATEDKKFRIDIEGMGVAGGYATIGGKIAINSKSDGLVKLSTLFHEIAHQLIHFDSDFVRADSSKQDRETDAESTAYVVCSHYHIESKDTPIYLAGFGANKDKILSRFKFIQGAAIEMFEGIDGVMSQMQEMQGKSPQEKEMEPDEMPTTDRVPEQSLATAGNLYGSLGLFKSANISPMPFIYERQDENSEDII